MHLHILCSMTEVPIANKKMFNVIFEDIKNNLLKKKEHSVFFYLPSQNSFDCSLWQSNIMGGHI